MRYSRQQKQKKWTKRHAHTVHQMKFINKITKNLSKNLLRSALQSKIRFNSLMNVSFLFLCDFRIEVQKFLREQDPLRFYISLSEKPINSMQRFITMVNGDDDDANKLQKLMNKRNSNKLICITINNLQSILNLSNWNRRSFYQNIQIPGEINEYESIIIII